MKRLNCRRKGIRVRILAIDTSNQTLSIAVCENQKILGSYTATVKRNHSLTLMPAIDYLMSQLNLAPTAIDRFVVAEGPGSYTGLRLGVTTAKTLAYTLKKELVGISSLQTLAANCVGQTGLVVPLFDARRKNVYAGAYRFVDGVWQNELPDQHISLRELLEQLKNEPNLFFVGGDVEKFTEEIAQIIPHGEICDVPQWQIPNAAVLAALGSVAEPVENVHGFLPAYLKKVEAEENWLKTHTPNGESYVEKL